MKMDLIILKHVVKGFAELIRHLLNFELFTVNLILNVVNPIMRRKKSINLVVQYLALQLNSKQNQRWTRQTSRHKNKML
jgi:hypothetical protein